MELNWLNLLKGKEAFAHNQQSAQLQISAGQQNARITGFRG